MKNIDEKLLSYLGLANRAGKIIIGSKANKKLMHKLYLVILARDASEKTNEIFLKKSKEYNIPVKIYANSITLGKALGFPPVKVVGFKDLSFAEAFLKHLNAGKEVNSNGGDLNG